MSLVTHSLTACAECDGLQRIPPLEAGAAAYCSRCGGEIFRCQPHSLDRTLSFLVAAAVLFIGANANDLMELHSSGIHTSTSIFGTAVALRDHGRASMAILVLLTTIALPAAELIALIALLAPLRMGLVPAWTPYAYRLALFLRPWVLVDVFLLAALISWSRLSQIAEAYTSAGLFAVGGYVILRALAWQAFEPQEVWRRVEELERVPATGEGQARA